MSQEFLLLLSLIILPFITGIFSFLRGQSAKWVALFGSIITLILVKFLGYNYLGNGVSFQQGYQWIPTLGASFSLAVGGDNFVLLLLTALVFPLTYLVTISRKIKNEHQFYGLMSLSMSGLMGVFLANDLLLFYFFWELALIPVYFLASMWGSKRRASVAFKFFIYTFLGSLLMLAGIIYLYINTNAVDFSYNNLMVGVSNLNINVQWVIWIVFFIAFAIKMPIFPLHTWQPDAYQHTYTPVTVILSAVMVKMGLFAAIKWLMPLSAEINAIAGKVVIILALISILYGSLLALVQTNIKRMLAYSSIAHIGLMALVIFINNKDGLEAATLQMFNHGINIAGLWLMVYCLEAFYDTQEMNEMGKLANIAPVASIFLLIFTLANIGLPLTNAFVGEFLLFNNVLQHLSVLYMVIAGLSIILAAIYSLNMLQKVVFQQRENVKNVGFFLPKTAVVSFVIIVLVILILGVYPKLIMDYIYF